MLKFTFGILSAVLLSSCASRTEIYETNKTTQTIFSSGQTLLSGEPQTKVLLEVSGHVILSDKCQFLRKNFAIEILQNNSSKVLHMTYVTLENSYKFDVSLAVEGEYKIQLIDSRSNKIIESKKFMASKTNDRFQFDFHGCP